LAVSSASDVCDYPGVLCDKTHILYDIGCIAALSARYFTVFITNIILKTFYLPATTLRHHVPDRYRRFLRHCVRAVCARHRATNKTSTQVSLSLNRQFQCLQRGA